ncbi:MAG: PAS sensor histidine kinase, partial [halophilic archaeon J07HX5]
MIEASAVICPLDAVRDSPNRRGAGLVDRYVRGNLISYRHMIPVMSMSTPPAEICVLSVTGGGGAVGDTLEDRFDRFTVATATSAAEGLDWLQAGAFDCVLSEYEMARTDGIGFLQAVRKIDTELPFILHTDSGSEKIASEAISAGVTDYVQTEGQDPPESEHWDRLADRITHAVSTQQTAADRSQQRLEQTLKTVPACIVQLGPDGEFTFANERATEVLGIDRSELIGRTYNGPNWAITDTAGNPIPDEELPFQQVRETGEPIEDVRHTITLPDGTEKVISVNGAPLEDDTGALRSVLFAITDITGRYERQQTLERQNDVSKKAQAVADVGAWEYDVAADSLHWSEQVYEIHDIDQGADVQLADAIEFYHPEDRVTIQEALTAVIEAGEPYETEARLITAEGAERWVRTSADPQTENGSVARLRGTIQDITASKTREQQLQRQRDRYQSLFETPADHLGEDFSAAAEYVA